MAKLLAGSAMPDPCRRKSGDEASLLGLVIPRQERRRAEQRREQRFRGVIDEAVILFRGRPLMARVLNLSCGGLMVETDIVPNIGETMVVSLGSGESHTGAVRWVRQGRVGLELGEGAIELTPRIV